MATTSFILNEFTGSDAQVQVTLTDVNTDTVEVKLDVVSGYIADTVGFFVDFENFLVANNFTITPVAAAPGPALTVGTTPGTGILYMDDSGSTVDSSEALDQNVNLNGGGITRNYQLGVQIGVGGIGSGDDYQSVTFNLTAAGLDVSDFSKVGVRLQAVDVDRNGSSKLEGFVSPDDGTNPLPAITIDKVTNGGDGLTILEGSAVTWTYTVTNTGNVDLSNVSVTDDQVANITYISGDVDNDNVLDLTESWIYTAAGTTTAGDYSNIGTATGQYGTLTVTANDPSNYFGADPSAAINKTTNGGDGLTILEGNAVTWTYTVTNTGNVSLSNVSITDDRVANITYVSGDVDNDNVLDLTETWTYTATGTAVAGDYTNIGTVTAPFTDSVGNTETATASDPSNYFGANPGININKITDNGAVQGDGILVQEGSAIKWIYEVTNTGNVALSNITVADDQVTAGITYVSGDTNNNSLLDTDEKWVYEASGTAILGSYTNTGTATGAFTDSLGSTETATDTDTSSYNGVKVAGARTPGFWQRWTTVWDRDSTNDGGFAERDNFAGSDLLLAPYSAPTIDPVTNQVTVGVLVGDVNRNGVTDGSERTVFFTLQEAQNLVNADKKAQEDKRYTLGRSLVASWLNYLAGNPAPLGDMNQAIQWLQTYTPDQNGDNIGDGDVTLGAAVRASSAAWSDPADIYNRLPTGEILNAKLDYYNNTGSFGIQPI